MPYRVIPGLAAVSVVSDIHRKENLRQFWGSWGAGRPPTMLCLSWVEVPVAGRAASRRGSLCWAVTQLGGVCSRDAGAGERVNRPHGTEVVAEPAQGPKLCTRRSGGACDCSLTPAARKHCALAGMKQTVPRLSELYSQLSGYLPKCAQCGTRKGEAGLPVSCCPQGISCSLFHNYFLWSGHSPGLEPSITALTPFIRWSPSLALTWDLSSLLSDFASCIFGPF